MSDTRTIYLKNNEGTIYSSDPSNVGSEYLDMSGFDSLNPSENSIFTSATNISLMYSSYDVKLVLTFMSDYDNGRQARAQWIAKNQNSINQISVANTNNQDLIFSKQAKIKTIDFVENPYVNGVQAELTLELAGRWQSSVKRTSATVYPYTGGTKKYSYKYRQQNPVPQTNAQGQINRLFNTEWSPDFSGWNIGVPNTSGKFTATTPLASDKSWSLSSEKFGGSNVLSKTYGSGISSINSGLIPIGGNAPSTVAIEAYSSSDYNGTVTVSLRLYYYDSNQNYISHAFKDSGKIFSWTRPTFSATSPSNAAYVVVSFVTNGSVGKSNYSQPMLVFSSTVGDYVPGVYKDLSTNTYKYGYQIITDEVKTDGYNGFIINIPSQTTPVNVTLTAPNGLSATIKTSQTNVPLQISSDMIGYSLDNFDTFTLLNKGFPASKYWDNLLSVYSTIQTILNANTVTVSVASGTGSSIPFEFYLYKLQDLI